MNPAPKGLFFCFYVIDIGKKVLIFKRVLAVKEKRVSFEAFSLK